MNLRISFHVFLFFDGFEDFLSCLFVFCFRSISKFKEAIKLVWCHNWLPGGWWTQRNLDESGRDWDRGRWERTKSKQWCKWWTLLVEFSSEKQLVHNMSIATVRIQPINECKIANWFWASILVIQKHSFKQMKSQTMYWRVCIHFVERQIFV